MATFDLGHVSNLPGGVAWGGAILMALFVWPYTRRRAYRVRFRFPLHTPPSLSEAKNTVFNCLMTYLHK